MPIKRGMKGEIRMKITVLAENTAANETLGSEHGLSILVEMKQAVILFDTGCGELFVQNAERLGVDLSKVTHLILSHGHYDHGGGIESFLRINNLAGVYLREEAFSQLYAIRAGGEIEYIGIPQGLRGNPRLVFTRDRMEIAGGVTLYSDIRLSEPIPETNRSLMIREGEKLVPDAFAHEQVAEFTEDGKTLLLTGCSHHGIVSILRDHREKTGRTPDMVIGGFHLHSHTTGKAEDSMLMSVADHLAGTKARYFTCHCTGLPAYEELKKRLGGQISYLSGGQTMTI
jgi:7,8-dihydropterin-6-yl-methyl-4-(beta-D-ribofuranosyl)aminobenzene 5'-phosphate synthase